jgi:hypothetical protein
LSPPPSTVYATLEASWGFTPRKGLTVQAFVGDALCGETTSRDFKGVQSEQVGFVLDILARDGELPDCGSNGDEVYIQVLDGDEVLWGMSLIWDNNALHEVSPSGVTAP